MKGLILPGLAGVAWLLCFHLANAETILSSKDVVLMTFNVENLFDSTHDHAKLDYAFLPLAEKKTAKVQRYCKTLKKKKWRERCFHFDWSEKALAAKLDHVAKAITQDGTIRPDVVALQEIENLAILRRLAALVGSEYQPIIIEGGDARGIDLAFLTRLPLLGQPDLHRLVLKGATNDILTDMRGVLEINVNVDAQTKLTLFNVHLPAPHHPTEYRRQAIDALNNLLAKQSKGSLVVAMGDFNITAAEAQRSDLVSTRLQSQWQVGHLLFCQSCPKGTYYYPPEKSWSFLDMMLFSSTLTDHRGWEVVPTSFHVANKSKQQNDSQHLPKTFNPRDLAGVSDHWPLVVSLAFTKAP